MLFHPLWLPRAEGALLSSHKGDEKRDGISPRGVRLELRRDDGDDRVVSTWIGTNDTGAIDGDPAGGGAAGNDMVPVGASEHDAGAARTRRRPPFGESLWHSAAICRNRRRTSFSRFIASLFERDIRRGIIGKSETPRWDATDVEEEHSNLQGQQAVRRKGSQSRSQRDRSRQQRQRGDWRRGNVLFSRSGRAKRLRESGG